MPTLAAIRPVAATFALLTLLATLGACGEERSGEERSGEACSVHEDQDKSCRADGERGTQTCVPNDVDGGDDGTWSVCLADACDEVGASESCTSDDDVKGLHYCVEVGGERSWGACVVDPECTPGEQRPCFPESPEFAGVNELCELDEGGVPVWRAYCDTPLVLSFDRSEPTFISPSAAAAPFDVSGGGRCDDPQWPSAATPWLVLDRDQSGSIDGGDELFGNGTRLAAGGRAAHGFAALAELDDDRDGQVSAGDRRFAELMLWTDHDGDRRSSPWELTPLAAHGVVAIDLDLRREARCDAAGNCGVERSSFVYSDQGRAREGAVIDVYLRCQ